MRNAQEAIALAKQRAQQFDVQAALERKTNQALQLAKAQAHIRDDSEEGGEGPSGSSKSPLVDRQSDWSMMHVCCRTDLLCIFFQSTRMSSTSRIRRL
jgi:hypothetical protein